MPDPLPLGFEESHTRQRVLRAALEVFAADGIEATRVQDLLEAANVARRTFYRHFRGKEDVLSALYEHVTAELVRALTPTSLAGDPVETVREVLDAYLRFHVDHHRITRLLVGEALRAGSPLAPVRHRFRAQLATVLGGVCAQASGRVLDPYVFLALISALEGLSLELLREAPPRDADLERVRATLRGLLDATLAHAELLPAAPRPDR